MKNILLTLTTFSIGITSVVANELEPLTDTTKSLKIAEKPASKHWYETISLKGYAQVRYNRLGETNPNLKCAQCDGYWGNNTGVSFRRARLTFSGQLSPRVYFYFQNDIAQTVAASGMSGAMQSNGTLLNLTQIRDAYFDVNLNKSGSMRIRLGQSKVPFGFDVLQSSQNRLSFDRSDAINSGVYNERDLGAFFMYSPESKKKLFASLVKENLKGSGDYGVFAFGFYNGQTTNRPEINNNRHIVARFTYPVVIGSQIIEAGLQSYAGVYTYSKDMLSNGVKYVKAPTLKGNVLSKNTLMPDATYLDNRTGVHFVLFPKPFGIQAEYNVGNGAQYNTNTDSIEYRSLEGGYVTFSYKTEINKQSVIPYLRLQNYVGGKKAEIDARSYDIKEMELGIEWQVEKNLEFTAAYVNSSRRFEDHNNRNNLQTGSLIRLQAQLNF
ncbi:MAG: hypothetical protein RIS91_857 [Bacteroidota bacterium]|nr:porin [Bacteroidia bacterium]